MFKKYLSYLTHFNLFNFIFIYKAIFLRKIIPGKVFLLCKIKSFVEFIHP